MKTVYKPWGKEEWLELNDRYCYKRIYINAGYRTSYQYHEFKKETNYIIEGEAEVWLENDEGVVEKKIMKAGEYFNVTPPKKHRVIALTDIILQEVSTPEVDDVFRIEDDTNRVDGKIEGEHQTPGVLILAAGKGTRLSHLTEQINKALLPINNEAILSKIIKQFPETYKFIIAVGYKSISIKEYCNIVFPNHDITFVDISDIDSTASGPGLSALLCREYLQRPFYITTADCLLINSVPKLDSNWLGLHRTSYPEKYSTAKLDGNDVVGFINKSKNGFDNAFIGIAGILEYEVFWNELQSNCKDGEIVNAFFNPSKYRHLKGKQLEWFDTGNFDDLEKARMYFKDSPLSLEKTTGEILYKDNNRLIKFIPNERDLKDLYERARHLGKLVPNNVGRSKSFLFYDWIPGTTLYARDDFDLYIRFIEKYLRNVDKVDSVANDIEHFYIIKTEDRYNKFIETNGDEYINTAYTINSTKYPCMDTVYRNLNFNSLYSTSYNKNFHGDLQFDNIIVNNEQFTYIDWRRNFGSSTTSGDVYYDLAKLYGGILIPYNLMKNENNITLKQAGNTVEYSYKNLTTLSRVQQEYELLLEEYGYDFKKIKFITGLIYLNMAPMHSGNFSKLLWFEAIKLLSQYANK